MLKILRFRKRNGFLIKKKHVFTKNILTRELHFLCNEGTRRTILIKVIVVMLLIRVARRPCVPKVSINNPVGSIKT